MRKSCRLAEDIFKTGSKILNMDEDEKHSMTNSKKRYSYEVRQVAEIYEIS